MSNDQLLAEIREFGGDNRIDFGLGEYEPLYLPYFPEASRAIDMKTSVPLSETMTTLTHSLHSRYCRFSYPKR